MENFKSMLLGAAFAGLLSLVGIGVAEADWFSSCDTSGEGTECEEGVEYTSAIFGDCTTDGEGTTYSCDSWGI